MNNVDSVLIEQAKTRPEAFGELLLRYQNQIFNYLYRMTGQREDAADLAQETFLRVYKSLDRFKEGAPFRPWVYKIATNVAINHLRARKATLPLDDDLPVHEDKVTPEHMAELRELQLHVGQVLLELPEAYRAVLLMRHIEELSYEEMAQALDVPLGTVKVRLHRARIQLMDKLRAGGAFDENDELQRSARALTALP